MATISFLALSAILAMVAVEVSTPEEGVFSSLGLVGDPGQTASGRIGQVSAAATESTVLLPVAQPTMSAAKNAPTPAPVATMAPVSTASTTVVPSPTAVPSGTPGAARASFRTLVDQQFSSVPEVASSGWPNDPQGGTWLADGAYHIIARQAEPYTSVAVPAAESVRDVVATGELRELSGPDGAAFGLILRQQPPSTSTGADSFYLFAINNAGQYSIRRREGPAWVDIVPWTHSDAVGSGSAANQLTVQAVGSSFAFLINGTRVASQQDGTLRSGSLAIFADGGTEIAVDRLVVRALD